MTKKLILPFVVAVVACGDDKVSVSEVNSRTSAIAGRSARNVVQAFASLETMHTWSSIDVALTNLDLAFAGAPAMSPTTEDPAMSGEPVPPPPDQVGSEEGESMSPEQTEQAVRAALETYIFNEQNLESSDEDSAVFLIRGESVCGRTTTCDINGCHEQPDYACIEAVNRLELRIDARPVGDDGIDLTIMVGPERAAPIVLQLRTNSITIDIDLGAAKSAVLHIASISGETVDLPRVMLGKLRFSLTVNGEQDVTVAASVLEAVAIEVDGANGPTRFDAGAADGFSMRAQGLIGRLSVELDGGAVSMSRPYADVTPLGTGSGTLTVESAGSSWSVVLDEGQQSLDVTNIGLGDSAFTVKKDDVTLFALNLNPSSGRRFDLNVTPDPSGTTALFTVSPEFDLTEAFLLQAIAADFPEIESHFYDETYRVLLAGDGSASVLPVPADELSGWQGGLQVVSGRLTLSSTAASAPVVVNAGECLTGTSTPPADSHPLLGYFVVTACP